MGVMIAISAFPRVVGPFIALGLLEIVNWKTWLEFGICAGLFGTVFLVVIQNLDSIVPYEDFLDEFEKGSSGSKSIGMQANIHLGPIPSPIIGRSPAVVRKRRPDR
jgi:hypothetical protein